MKNRSIFIMKEPGSDKWIAPKTFSGYSSNRDDARIFHVCADAISLLMTDKRYKGIAFSSINVEYMEN